MNTNGHKPPSNGALQYNQTYDIIDNRRKVEIFSQIVRHLTALVYLVAELVIGQKPEKL